MTAEDFAAAVAAAIPGAATAVDFGFVTADVPADRWVDALTVARDDLRCSFFDWLSAVDEVPESGSEFSVVAHVYDPVARQRLLLRTRVTGSDGEPAALPTATGVYAGAGWHERETHEMFGIDFPGHPHLVTLLLPDGFAGHPLRKDFELAARASKSWPGAKEPGESDTHAAPSRRRTTPPGVPDPDWGPRPPGPRATPAPAEPADADPGDA